MSRRYTKLVTELRITVGRGSTLLLLNSHSAQYTHLDSFSL